MKNVYLFYVSNNPLWSYFPNSVLSLCNPLLKAGFTPKIIDTALERWEEQLQDPLFIGFSIYTDSNIATAIKIAGQIRRLYPEVPLVWGGPHVIMKPEQTACHHLVDFACYQEGELAVAELAKALFRQQDSFENVCGILWKNSDGQVVKNAACAYVNMDDIEPYPYQLLNEKFYRLRHGKIYYEASRGCTFRCKFCSYDHSRWRFRAADKVIEDLSMIEQRFAPEEIQITDANHFMNIEWVKSIWSQKLSRGLKFRWETNCRFDTLASIDEEVLNIIAGAGCYQLRLGAESGSQKILDYLHKGITVKQIIQGLLRCRSHGIHPLVSFMMGYPTETDEDIDQTVGLINLIKKEFPETEINGLFQFQPYPNTRIFREIAAQHNIIQPHSLEGWQYYQIIEMRRQDFPWLTDSRYKRYKVLNSIVSYLFFADKIKHMSGEQRQAIPLLRVKIIFMLFKLCDFFIRRISIPLRWDRKCNIAPWEWRFWDFIRKYILKLF